MLTQKLSSSTEDLFTSKLLCGIRSLVDMIVSDVEFKESERTHMKEALPRNGNPDWLINS